MNEPDGVTYDSEMHDAIVKDIAQWICRQCLGNSPRFGQRKIIAYTRQVLADPQVAADRSVAALDARAIATEAEALADRHMETDVNWDQWAFGH